MKRYTFGLLLCSILLLIFTCKDDENVGNPKANFNLPGGQLHEGCPIKFINVSSNATSYLWDFGDGNTSTEIKPTHTYDVPGAYVITLTVYGEDTEDKVTQVVQISEGNVTFESGRDAYARLSSLSAVVISPAGGYVSTGYRWTDEADTDVFLMKVDAYGNLQWERNHGGSDDDEAFAITTASDGGYVLTGRTGDLGESKSDVYVIKVNAYGELQWEKTFGGNGNDRALGIAISSDGGYLVVGGITDSLGTIAYRDIYLIKLDANGNLQWEKTFGGDNDDRAFAITASSDGGYVLAGYTENQGADLRDVYIIKVDANGNLQWEKTFGGTGIDVAHAIVTSPDGGYALAGYTWSQGAGQSDVYLIKVDANGNLQWEKTFGGENSDEAYAITNSSDGGYVLTGETRNVIYLIKVDANGNLQWEKTFGGNDFQPFYQGYSIKTTDECGYGYIIAGRKNNSYLLKTDSEGNVN